MRIGYLKIAMFPDMVGVKVANEISNAVAKLGAVESLIIDLRGNTGGGIGALRVMSLLTPDRIPVGFALDRRRVTANLESEKAGIPAILADSVIDQDAVAPGSAIRPHNDGKEAHRPPD